MTVKILVSGAGVAGTALVNFLCRSKHEYDITVVERAPALRAAGSQLDLKSFGAPLMRKLGLIEKVREKSIHETAFTFVDSKGREWARFPVNEAGKGYEGITSEFEIMRADLVAVLYEASKEVSANPFMKGPQKLRYVFGKHGVHFTQGNSKVNVVFSDGSSDDYDLVVGADGQYSMTRRLLWEPEKGSGDTTLKYTGVTAGFFQMPKSEDEADSTLFKNCLQAGPRGLCLRCAHKDFTQAMLGIPTTDEHKQVFKKPLEQQKQMWEESVGSFKWQGQRVLAELRKSDDFYMTPVAQVKVDRWSKGRVVLVGDAGYCPSVMTGRGTTVSLVGAYVLAGELAKHGDNIDAALESYEKVLRPFITTAQEIPSMGMGMFQSKFGVGVFYVLLAIISKLKIDRLLQALMKEEKETWELPEYPELEFEA
uniref:FAD-dependent monooxygenase asL6 n=1 Tax=Sarocladium schorii TaxID=2203296 RepID=ASL6_SARSH|nr:RecName: Full=FAD-dependent monooxygenase asL6; AltName: Full=Xenovulene A biosynthesis cluster protein L6 [Sarocladium sp. 'schorii']AWM95784.1 FAD-dependent monooxygenase [Sarocladium sp. 'schorii']